MENVYLDYAATTPVLEKVKKEMILCADNAYGNPSSLHFFGSRAREAVDEARSKVAGFLNSKEREVIFTCSATQSNNLALLGVLKNYKNPHVITTPVEHKAVLEPLKNSGAKISYLSVSSTGLVNPEEVLSLIEEETVLVSIGYANSEVGVVQPIKQIGEVVRKVNEERKKKIVFHTDAVQAVNYLSCDVRELGVDMFTLSGHKIYGPKGVGVLFVKEGVSVSPVSFGASQERGLVPGTENVPAMVGLGFAVEEIKEGEAKRVQELRDKIIRTALEEVPDSFLNGDKENRLPNNVNLSFQGVEGESLMFALDNDRFAVSTGSACASSSLDPSYVLLAMGMSHERAHGSVRISLGRFTTEKQVDLFLERLKINVEKLRKISGR